MLYANEVLVAQWIERPVAVRKVAGSIPAKHTKKEPTERWVFVCLERVNDFTLVRNRTPEQFSSADENARRWPDKFLWRQKFSRGRDSCQAHKNHLVGRNQTRKGVGPSRLRLAEAEKN